MTRAGVVRRTERHKTRDELGTPSGKGRQRWFVPKVRVESPVEKVLREGSRSTRKSGWPRVRGENF